jgi:hypothetical protein
MGCHEEQLSRVAVRGNGLSRTMRLPEEGWTPALRPGTAMRLLLNRVSWPFPPMRCSQEKGVVAITIHAGSERKSKGLPQRRSRRPVNNRASGNRAQVAGGDPRDPLNVPRGPRFDAGGMWTTAVVTRPR